MTAYLIFDALKQTRRTAALSLCLLCLACGGGDSSPASAPISLPPTVPSPTPPPPTPAPPPTPVPTPAPPDFEPVIAAAEAFDDPAFALIIGDASGILLEYEKGGFSVTDPVPVASASKWYTAATIMRLVDAGVMRLEDHPQDHLTFWTSDPVDPRSQVTLAQLLSFTSGFNANPAVSGCIEDPTTTILACAEEIYTNGIATDPGTAYAYGPHHMQIAAAMAEQATGQSFEAIFQENIASFLGMSAASTYRIPRPNNPRVSGGAVSTGRDYARFLGGLLDGSLIADQDSFLADRTSNVTFLFRPDGAVENGDWHYALGAWLECDEEPFVPSCADARIYSSPGSFGWTPWIDFHNGYFAIIARRGERGTADIGVALEQILQPLIVEALGD